MKNILLICGGGGSEHDISLTSASFIKSHLEKISTARVFMIKITKDGQRLNEQDQKVELRKGGLLYNEETEELLKLHFAIPCFHGPPGETGQIQSVFEMMNLPYLGCRPEANMLCFNKISTKLWLNAGNIPNTPFCILKDMDDINKARDFFNKCGDVFVKASSQGSSIGCYKVTDGATLVDSIKKAFELSPYVLVEKSIEGRELEVSVYEHHGEIKASFPGEIICPDRFYSYEEKYSVDTHTKTQIKAEAISDEVADDIKKYSLLAFKLLKLRHLSRIDFFLTDEGNIYINEINTFPGMTPISMFPKMMENDGLPFFQFLEPIIQKDARS